MTTIEYYYPLETLTTNSVSNKFFFKNDSLTNTKINFATTNGIQGTAKEYYIKTIKETDTKIVDGATHYLVILHENANIKFYVLFPLKSVSDVTSYIKSNRNGGILSKSIENLNNIGAVNTKVKFSLESVVDSMKSFNPTSYYDFSVTKIKTHDVFVMNDLIYVKTIAPNKFYDGDVEFNPVSSQISRLQASIQKVSTTSECKVPAKKRVKTKKTLLSGLSYAEQSKLNYMNFVMMLGSLLYLLAFYHLYYNYDVFKTKHTSILIFMVTTLLFIIIPVGTTLLLQNTKGAKINKTDLRYAVTFARYSIFAIAVSLFAIFSKQILGLFRGGRPEWSYFKTNWALNLFFAVAIGAVLYFSFIIFFKV
jgi:hypothetical protein